MPKSKSKAKVKGRRGVALQLVPCDAPEYGCAVAFCHSHKMPEGYVICTETTTSTSTTPVIVHVKSIREIAPPRRKRERRKVKVSK